MQPDPSNDSLDLAFVFALSVNRTLPAKAQELIRVVKAEFAERLAKLEATQ